MIKESSCEESIRIVCHRLKASIREIITEVPLKLQAELSRLCRNPALKDRISDV